MKLLDMSRKYFKKEMKKIKKFILKKVKIKNKISSLKLVKNTKKMFGKFKKKIRIFSLTKSLKKIKELQNKIPLYVYGLGFLLIGFFFVYLFMREMNYLFFLNTTYQKIEGVTGGENFLVNKCMYILSALDNFISIEGIELFTQTIVAQNITGIYEMFLYIALSIVIFWIAVGLLLSYPIIFLIKKIIAKRSKKQKKVFVLASNAMIIIVSFLLSVSFGFSVYGFTGNQMVERIDLEEKAIEKTLKSSFFGENGEFEKNAYYGNNEIKEAIANGNKVNVFREVESAQEMFDFYVSQSAEEKGTYLRTILVPRGISKIEITEENFPHNSALFPSGEFLFFDMTNDQKEEIVASLAKFLIRDYFSDYTNDDFGDMKVKFVGEDDLKEYKEQQRTAMMKEINAEIWKIDSKTSAFNKTIATKNNEIALAKNSLKRIDKDKDKYVRDQREDYRKDCKGEPWEEYDYCKNRKKQTEENDKILDAQEADREKTIAEGEATIAKTNNQKNTHNRIYSEVRGVFARAKGHLEDGEYEYIAYDSKEKTVFANCNNDNVFDDKCLGIVIFGAVRAIESSEDLPWTRTIDTALTSLIAENITKGYFKKNIELPFDYKTQQAVLKTIIGLEGVEYEDMKHLYVSDRSNKSFNELLNRIAPKYNAQGNFTEKLKALRYVSDEELELSLVESLNKSLITE